jgi:hypothetical protein
MEQKMMLSGTRVTIVYTVDAHGGRIVEAVLLPGDALDVLPKLTEKELKRVYRSLDRN